MSQLIADLEKLKNLVGDLDVKYPYDGMDGYNELPVNSMEIYADRVVLSNEERPNPASVV